MGSELTQNCNKYKTRILPDGVKVVWPRTVLGPILKKKMAMPSHFCLSYKKSKNNLEIAFIEFKIAVIW